MTKASGIMKRAERAAPHPPSTQVQGQGLDPTMRSPGQEAQRPPHPRARLPLTAGTTIASHYRLERKVGSGGMGEVWAAEHLTIHMRVAVKVLLEGATCNPEIAARLEREAVLLGRTHGCHVARVIDFVHDEMYGPVLVTEFVEGSSLAEVIKTPLTVEQAIDLGIDLATGVSELHRANVVHRDLKPANVIVRTTEGGELRSAIIDLGVGHVMHESTRAEGGELSALTGGDTIVGTLEYMPPEQLLCCAEVTAVADIYAMGALLLRAVSGHNVFGVLDRADLVHAKLTREAPPLETGRLDPLAEGLAAVVNRALSRSPAGRYQSAEEMRADLCRLRDERDRTTQSDQSPSSDLEASRRRVGGAASAALQLAREVSRRVLAAMIA
jgi:eukaryotic-like serine/threonine-protein kinase